LDELETRVNHAAALWEEALARPIDASRMVLVGDGTYEFPVWAVLMQALKHGIAERTQICPPLAKLVGVALPSLDPYAYATSTGRGGLLPCTPPVSARCPEPVGSAFRVRPARHGRVDVPRTVAGTPAAHLARGAQARRGGQFGEAVGRYGVRHPRRAGALV